MTPDGAVAGQEAHVNESRGTRATVSDTGRNAGRDTGGDLIDRLVTGDESAWHGFVERYNRVIYGAIYKVLGARGVPLEDDAVDCAQDVFVRICKDEFRLLKRYDPARAAITTWLTVVATSTTKDFLRKRRAVNVPLDEMPTEITAVDPVMPVEKLKFPDGLLSPRQAMVLEMIFEQDLDVAEVAEILGIDPQTVRSTQHKALVKLRKLYGERREE